MNVPTLVNNILLLEEKTYGTDTCPNGTTLSLNNFKPKNVNLFVRLWQSLTGNVKKVFGGDFSGSAIAAGPSPDKLYCIAPTTLTSDIDYTSGATSTKVYIQPQKILSANTKYFVVVKGDENLSSDFGVVSINKIGLNGSSSWTDYSHILNPEFNGITFKNAYSFGFTTMADNAGKSGLCAISNVVVKPSSFLIKTAEVDTSDDNPSDSKFDTVSDNDRAVSVFAYSADNQLLQPISGYNWNWDWKVDDISVVRKDNVSGLKPNQIVVSSVKKDAYKEGDLRMDELEVKD